jgi:hypothetical protein
MTRNGNEGCLSEPTSPVFNLKIDSFVNMQVRSAKAGNTKGGSITVLLNSCLTGLD